MSKARTGAGAAALLAVFALLWSLAGMDGDTAVNATPNQRAAEERLRILSGISEGQVLYLKTVQYDKRNPASLGLPWTPPEHTIEETWMAEDDDGAFTTYTTVMRDTDGEVVSHSRLEDGQRVATWAATGDRVTEPFGDEESLSWWVVGLWQTAANLANSGYEPVGAGRWYGQPTAIYENETTYSINVGHFSASLKESMGLAPDQKSIKQTVIRGYEFVVDSPLLYRNTEWTIGEDGGRKLSGDFRIVEYRLLPADARIGPFDR